jgi:hypothetical protein
MALFLAEGQLPFSFAFAFAVRSSLHTTGQLLSLAVGSPVLRCCKRVCVPAERWRVGRFSIATPDASTASTAAAFAIRSSLRIPAQLLEFRHGIPMRHAV